MPGIKIARQRGHQGTVVEGAGWGWREPPDIRHSRLAVYLAFPDFIQRFAVYTLGGRWPRFQTLDADWYAAGLAIAVVIQVQQVQRGVDFANQFPLPITGFQFQAELFLIACPVHRIGIVARFALHMMNRPINLFHKLPFPALKYYPEMVFLSLVHVGFIPLGLVGDEAECSCVVGLFGC